MKLLVYFLENLRYITFWSIDFLKGAKIYKHYKNISYLLNDFSSEKSRNFKEENLKNILDHAVKTTRFYKKIENYNAVEDFPVVNKNIINNNLNTFISKTFINRKLKTVQTSGSTGLRFKIYQDKNKIYRNTADTIYFSKKAGFKIGYKLIYLRLWDEFLRKTPLSYFIKNIQPENILNLNDDRIDKLVNDLKNDTSRKSIMAYASGLEQICRYLDTIKFKPINSNIKSTIAVAEALSEYTRISVKKYFNSPIVSRYSNSENGILAQQKNNESLDFCINWASYYFEILDFNTDTPVKNNELGRIVITDLFNYATPLIRYDTGDIGRMDCRKTPPVLTKIEGRKGDLIFNTKGEAITKFITICLIPYKEIKQGQLIQEDKLNYTLKLNVSKNFNQEKELIQEFKGYLGADSNVSLKYVNEIPVLSSGKRRLTVNNYIK